MSVSNPNGETGYLLLNLCQIPAMDIQKPSMQKATKADLLLI